MIKLCPPALIYVVFSMAQIIIDSFKGLYNTAFMKLVVAILVTFLLNGLCTQGLGVVSWMIVFIPFILMTFIVTMLLYIFGMNVAIGAETPEKTQNLPDKTQKNNSFPPPVIKSDYFPYYDTSPAYESFSTN